jgi:GNAT superfamily N-acetyltransferase
VQGAARCLTEYGKKAWGSVPALASLQDPAEATATLQALWEQASLGGTAALRDGRVEGYLLGGLQVPPPATVASIFAPARSVDVALVGCVVSAGEDAGALAAPLYGAAAERWVEAGCFAHAVNVMASDTGVLAAWHSLGFGFWLGFAIRETDGAIAAEGPGEGVTFRRASPVDLPVVVDLVLEQLRTLASGPVLNPYLPECRSDVEATVAGLLADPAAAAWLAFERGKAISLQTLFGYPSGLAVPDATAYLQYCVTTAAARNRGIASALLVRALAWAKETGYRHVASSWLTANAPMGAFLAKHGFHPLMYKLGRRVDERIGWATAR